MSEAEDTTKILATYSRRHNTSQLTITTLYVYTCEDFMPLHT